MADAMETGAAIIEWKCQIHASRGTVWDALVNRTADWWPSDFHTSRETKAFRIEPFPGGRVYEDAGEGRGTLWFTVSMIEAPEVLRLSGVLFPGFGGPATSLVTIRLVGEGLHCRLELEDALFGAIGANAGEEVLSGWREIFEQHFKRYVEALGKDAAE